MIRITDEVLAWLILLRAPQCSANKVRKWIAAAGSAQAALESARRSTDLAAETLTWLRVPDAKTITADRVWLEADGHHLISCDSADYPTLLASAPQAPAALFVAGNAALLWSSQIAVVGARRASAGGLANARAFASAFVQAGNVVTSGMAEGIDGAAHDAALEAGGATIAVLGTGADIIYPRCHRDLAERIVANGALVSEFSPGTTGRPEFFPRRNRIISGLSLGTLVIEAGLKSGSLITARLAAEQGREVFALPGSIHNPLARGCHRLIRDGVRLVEEPNEVLDELHAMGKLLGDSLRNRLRGARAPVSSRDVVRSVHGDDPDYVKLLGALDQIPAALDELAARSGLSAAALSSMLLLLELEGTVVAESGGRYALAP